MIFVKRRVRHRTSDVYGSGNVYVVSMMSGLDQVTSLMKTYRLDGAFLDSLDENERVLASCTIAREQVEYGDYDASCAGLAPWWKLGDWPNQVGLTRDVAAELLLTPGCLTGLVDT